MLRFDLDNENETIRNYRDRIPQCEALGEYAMAEQIREISCKSRTIKSIGHRLGEEFQTSTPAAVVAERR